MPRHLPPLNPLRVFEAAARHVSFTRAADELSVTQAAVSRQIAVLEGYLRVSLFERHPSGLRLTEAGAAYLKSIRQAFDLIDAATAEVKAASTAEILRLRVYNTFAICWLIPRLHAFRDLNPEVTIDLSTAVGPVDFERQDIEVSIALGDGEWPDLAVFKLFDDVIAPVCSPRFLTGRPVLSVDDLARCPLLSARYRRRDWADWLAAAGSTLRPRNVLMFESSYLSYQAAKEGIGIAMGQIGLLGADLSRGDLVTPFPLQLKRPLAYYVVHPPRLARDRRIRAFRDWILAEARKLPA